jgi:CheY-like chemotaxis protein
MTCILVVDDAAMVRRQVAGALQKLGYTVLEAFDGVDALQKLDETPTTQLIMLDIHMPNMNGLEFLERLRARGSTLPVVVLTAEAEPEVIRRAKELGAKAWLIKPLKVELLTAVVEKAVPRGRGEAPSSATPSSPVSKPGC